MDSMGIVCRHQKAVGHRRLPFFFAQAAAVGDPLQHIGQEGGVRPLTGIAAYLLVIKDRQHRQVLAGLRRQKALQTAEHALQVIQPGGHDELPL